MASIFNVLTEFKFEVGNALLSSDRLQQSVQGISNAADDALISFQKLGLGLVAQFGLGAGGIVGVLGKALQVSDKFRVSQIALSNIIGNVGGVFTKDVTTFEGRLQASADVMSKINKLASEFALPADDLLQFTKLIAPILGSKGLAGTNFNVAIDISRSLLKSAPTLGVDTSLIQGQLQRLVEGQASMGDTLFTRLISDTRTFSKFGQTGSKGFNVLPAAERVKLLQKALREFSSDTKVLEANVNTLSGQMRLLKNTIGSATGILLNFGNSIMKPILEVFKSINSFLLNQGKDILDTFGKIFNDVFHGSAKSILATLLQIRNLSSHVETIKTGFGLIGFFKVLQHTLEFLHLPTISLVGAFKLLGKAIGGIATVLLPIGRFLFSFVSLGAIWRTANFLTTLLSDLAGSFLFFTGILQLFSRAIAFARIKDVQFLADISVQITKTFQKFTAIFGVFSRGIDIIAEAISPIFSLSQGPLSFIVTNVVTLFDAIADKAIEFVGALGGILFAIFEFVDQIKNLFTGGVFSFAAIGDAFQSGIDAMIEEVLGKLPTGEATVQQTTYVNKVEIRNEFKEQLEPDRIAFTLKDQLMKAAANPTQARGNAFQAGFARR